VSLPYLLYPPSANAGAGKHPLIVFLHGAGERGDDRALLKLWGPAKYLDRGGEITAYVFVPQCPKDRVWDDVIPELEQLFGVLLDSYPIDPDAVTLTGFSMGGYGTCNWAMQSPGNFTALAPVAGARLGDRYEPCVIKDKPIWMIYSSKDEAVPAKICDTFADPMRNCSANLRVTRYEDASHVETADRAYLASDLYDWLLAQKRKE